MTLQTRIAIITCAALLTCAAPPTRAGELDPPAGPVAPTMKTLEQVEPRRPLGQADVPIVISESGSYYLTGDVTGVAGQHVIFITASNVTLDLNGFTVRGDPMALPLAGIHSVNVSNISVLNGAVTGTGTSGVSLNAATGVLVSGVRAIDCGEIGISINEGVVTDCVAAQNGLSGFNLGSQSVLSNSTSFENAGNGVSATSHALITGCNAYLNGATGISAGQASTVVHCTSASNTGHGYFIGVRGVISECTSTDNGAAGIIANGGNQVRNCSATSNGLDGIRVFNDCIVTGCLTRLNGVTGDGAGIRVSSGDNRIEGNNSVQNDVGIDLDSSTANFYAGNTCSGNTVNNYDVAAGNAGYVVSAVLSAAFSGSAGGVPPGPLNPWVNFSY